MPPELLIAGVPLVVVTPALVELAKGLGLPTKFAGVAAIVACGVVLGLVQLQSEPATARVATWALMSLVCGLAAAGFYSQVKTASRPDGETARDGAD